MKFSIEKKYCSFDSMILVHILTIIHWKSIGIRIPTNLVNLEKCLERTPNRAYMKNAFRSVGQMVCNFSTTLKHWWWQCPETACFRDTDDWTSHEYSSPQNWFLIDVWRSTKWIDSSAHMHTHRLFVNFNVHAWPTCIKITQTHHQHANFARR